MSKIALSMIVKGSGDEPKELNQCLYTVAPHVDAIYITVTGKTKEISPDLEPILKKYNANVTYERDKFIYTANKEDIAWLEKFFGYKPHLKEGDEVFCFDRARNYSLEQVPKDKYPYFIWLDTDDVLRYGEKLKDVVKWAEEKNIGAVYFNYLYQVEYDKTTGKIKSVIIQHLRERVVRNNGDYKWVAPIHETLIEQIQTSKLDDYRCDVVHLSSDEKRIKSLERNLGNLEYSVFQTQGKDPRPLYYLAKAYYDLRTTEDDNKAIKLINIYLHGENKSGWPEERAQAWEYLGEIYRRKGEHVNSIVNFMNALIEMPEFPSTYLNLAVTYMLIKQWEKAMWWVKMAASIPEKKTTLISNPLDTQARTLQVIYEACLNTNKVDEAWAAAVKLKEILPDDPIVHNNLRFIDMVRQERDMSKYIVHIADYLKRSGEGSKIQPLLAATPSFMSNNPFIVDLFNKNSPPRVWDNDEIAILCGPGFTTWSPKRLNDPQGSFVGGSEEAVIQVSKQLQKQGWKVTVYGDPGVDEGIYDGVKWEPYYKCNLMDTFNILVLWRVVQHVDRDWKAKKIIVWAHDILNNLDYTKERVDKIYKVFVLSQWHRETIPGVPDDKIVITSNGI